MKAKRFGGPAGDIALLAKVCQGRMASNMGKAIVAAAPLSTVRREIGFNLGFHMIGFLSQRVEGDLDQQQAFFFDSTQSFVSPG